jgi:hypothetical protein
MNGQLEEPKQQQRDPKEEEDGKESIDFVQIDQSAKEKHDNQEEDHDQEHHHLDEGTAAGGGEQQERSLTDWSFDGTSIDSSVGGQSAAAEHLDCRLAALMVNYYFLIFKWL